MGSPAEVCETSHFHLQHCEDPSSDFASTRTVCGPLAINSNLYQTTTDRLFMVPPTDKLVPLLEGTKM